ncbi:uncharacterized protein TM35_000011920 [Trypanosoma theileri]|uniref:Uncharacterized protein n=1 Tax=Trypanosoma theileri TaxID=67003 RepID=A0A1X0P915_9TRYP|nr:uncharacterized protein TM35_000011920 [Trypanosoma theileri]ORC93315.1 hypothetical protein TM35_000011920 [Trypanosoma theileri]
MLRRCGPRRFGGHQQHSGREQQRITRERQRRILYDAAGNVRLSGLFFLAWEEFRRPLLAVGGGLFLFVAYNRLVVWLSQREAAAERLLDAESEAAARESGRLRGERFLVKPRRQMEDPDFLNVPSYAGKGVYSSKLFTDDTASSDPLFAEKRRN